MDTREIETKAGTFNVRVLTDVRNDRARVTVIIVNSLTSRMTLNALAIAYCLLPCLLKMLAAVCLYVLLIRPAQNESSS